MRDSGKAVRAAVSRSDTRLRKEQGRTESRSKSAEQRQREQAVVARRALFVEIRDLKRDLPRLTPDQVERRKRVIARLDRRLMRAQPPAV